MIVLLIPCAGRACSHEASLAKSRIRAFCLRNAVPRKTPRPSHPRLLPSRCSETLVAGGRFDSREESESPIGDWIREVRPLLASLSRATPAVLQERDSSWLQSSSGHVPSRRSLDKPGCACGEEPPATSRAYEGRLTGRVRAAGYLEGPLQVLLRRRRGRRGRGGRRWACAPRSLL